MSPDQFSNWDCSFELSFCCQVAGITVVGQDHYGVFPLRGKLPNIREASHKQIAENQETENIKKSLVYSMIKYMTTLNP